MTEILLIILIAINLVGIILALVALFRSRSWNRGTETYSAMIKNEFYLAREESNKNARQIREEIAGSFKLLSDSVLSRIVEISNLQKSDLNNFSDQLSKLIQVNENKLEQLKNKIEAQLRLLHENNSKKLDEMRELVDEKLQSTLEKRLGESFRLVSERLELVHKGLGEMQVLASGVGDLKRVLSNIKTRGTWGEIQLGNLIEQILTTEQYAKNIATKNNSSDRVEYAIKLPGRGLDGTNETVWMPIDAKFPLEDYQRLCEAQESGNLILVEEASRALENRIKLEAKNICAKYLDPPYTTDFALLFLPIEGLFAEVLRRPGLYDKLQREYRVILAGPTTLAAILNSLQLGFRTLAIEKRSSEVWKLLGTVKTEFSTFGDILDKTRKKLQEASNTIESATAASRRIERHLKDVESLPPSETSGNKSIQRL